MDCVSSPVNSPHVAVDVLDSLEQRPGLDEVRDEKDGRHARAGKRLAELLLGLRQRHPHLGDTGQHRGVRQARGANPNRDATPCKPNTA